MGIVRAFLLHQGKLLAFCGVLLKSLENDLQCMGGLETYSERIEVLCEGIFSKFGRTYPCVFLRAPFKIKTK
jgi:hypothetical protein